MYLRTANQRCLLAARQCPNGMTMIPAAKIAVNSNGLVCPGCQRPLEISGLSRNLASFIGLGVGTVVWWFTSAHFSRNSSALGWVLPVLYGYLALSIVSPLALIFLADLRLKSEVPAPALVPEESPAPHSSH